MSKKYKKKYYNRKSRRRHLKVGSKVLVLLPTKTNKLLMSWKGPYEVVEKLSVIDYRIKRGKKVKTFHINMLSFAVLNLLLTLIFPSNLKHTGK